MHVLGAPIFSGRTSKVMKLAHLTVDKFTANKRYISLSLDIIVRPSLHQQSFGSRFLDNAILNFFDVYAVDIESIFKPQITN